MQHGQNILHIPNNATTNRLGAYPSPLAQNFFFSDGALLGSIARCTCAIEFIL
jgi:hypothetical protein